MKKNILRLGCCLMLSLSGCTWTKVEPKLPPATQIGADTFGCKVNGKVWVATTQGAGFAGLAVINNIYTIEGFTYLDIRAKNRPFAEAEGIDLNFVSKKLTVGEYFIGQNADSTSVDARIVDFIPNGIMDSYLRTDLPASFKITYVDTVRRIVSGEFYFTAGGTNSQLYEITEGRFDISYTTIKKLR